MKVHPDFDFMALELSFLAYNESYLKGSFRCSKQKPLSFLQNQLESPLP